MSKTTETDTPADIDLPAGRVGFSIPELGDMGLGRKTFCYAEIAAGRLRALKVGGKTIVTPGEIRRYIREETRAVKGA